jgi:hypothetical protein
MEKCTVRCGNETVTTRPEGVAKVAEAVGRLGYPDIVSYTDIADGFTLKSENGEPEHTLGYLTFLQAGADITCLCIFEDALQACGYTAGADGTYIRQ